MDAAVHEMILFWSNQILAAAAKGLYHITSSLIRKILIEIVYKGRRQNTSVETGDFLQKYVKCMLVLLSFVDQLHPDHFTVKGHLDDDSQLLLSYT